MTEEASPSPAASEEQSSRVLRWIIVFAAPALLGVLSVIIYGYWAKPGWVGVANKNFWDYLELLVAPAAIGIGVAVLNWMQDARQHQAEERQKERERKAEAQSKERDRAAQAAQVEHALDVEKQRAQDAALQAYLEQMSQLLTDKEHPLRGAQLGDDLSAVARARTLTVLLSLDGGRKRSVLQFLYESRLIDRERTFFDESGLIKRRHNIVSLEGANLSGALLNSAKLREAVLIRASLSGADLYGADLSRGVLIGAFLSGAVLVGADLSGANLIRTHLSYANLIGADLKGADLRGANLSYANLSTGNRFNAAFFGGADLRGARLFGAKGWIDEQLLAAHSLEGAQMPDGRFLKSRRLPWGLTFEEWRKNKGHREDGENSSPP